MRKNSTTIHLTQSYGTRELLPPASRAAQWVLSGRAKEAQCNGEEPKQRNDRERLSSEAIELRERRNRVPISILLLPLLSLYRKNKTQKAYSYQDNSLNSNVNPAQA